MEGESFHSSFLSFFKKGCHCTKRGEPFIDLPNSLIHEPYKLGS